MKTPRIVSGAPAPEARPAPAARRRTGEAPVALWLLVAIAGAAIVRHAADVLVPLVLGVLVSYALEPAVAWLARRRVPRPLGAAVSLLGIAVVFGFGITTLASDATRIVNDLPTATAKLRTALRAHDRNPLAAVGRMASRIEQSAADAAPTPPAGVARVQIEEKVVDLRGWLWTGTRSALGLMSEGVLLAFLVYFLLASGNLYRRKILSIAGPSLARRRITLELVNEIGDGIQRYLAVLALANVMVGVASWIAS